MPKTIIIDPLSLTSLRIAPRYEDTSLAWATGFTTKIEGKSYLITNWHVVTGKDADTKKCLDKQHAAIPNSLVVAFHAKSQLGQWVNKTIPLYGSDDVTPVEKAGHFLMG